MGTPRISLEGDTAGCWYNMAAALAATAAPNLFNKKTHFSGGSNDSMEKNLTKWAKKEGSERGGRDIKRIHRDGQATGKIQIANDF